MRFENQQETESTSAGFYQNVIELALADREQIRFWTLSRGQTFKHQSFPAASLNRARVEKHGLYRGRSLKPVPGGLLCPSIFGRPYTHARRTQLGFIELGLPAAQTWLLRSTGLAYYGVFTGCDGLFLTRLIYGQAFVAHYDSTVHPLDYPWDSAQWTFTPWHVNLVQPDIFTGSRGCFAPSDTKLAWQTFIMDQYHMWMMGDDDVSLVPHHAPLDYDLNGTLWNSYDVRDTYRALLALPYPHRNAESRVFQTGFESVGCRLKPWNFASKPMAFEYRNVTGMTDLDEEALPPDLWNLNNLSFAPGPFANGTWYHLLTGQPEHTHVPPKPSSALLRAVVTMSSFAEDGPLFGPVYPLRQAVRSLVQKRQEKMWRQREKRFFIQRPMQEVKMHTVHFVWQDDPQTPASERKYAGVKARRLSMVKVCFDPQHQKDLIETHLNGTPWTSIDPIRTWQDPTKPRKELPSNPTQSDGEDVPPWEAPEEWELRPPWEDAPPMQNVDDGQGTPDWQDAGEGPSLNLTQPEPEDSEEDRSLNTTQPESEDSEEDLSPNQARSDSEKEDPLKDLPLKPTPSDLDSNVKSKFNVPSDVAKYRGEWIPPTDQNHNESESYLDDADLFTPGLEANSEEEGSAFYFDMQGYDSFDDSFDFDLEDSDSDDVSSNGDSPNGVSPNGVYPKGVSPNGVSPNGAYPKGVSPNGVYPKGVSPNGVYPNSVSPNGVSPNGVYPYGVSPNGVSPNGVSPNGIKPNSNGNGVEPNSNGNGVEPNSNGNGIEPYGSGDEPYGNDDEPYGNGDEPYGNGVEHYDNGVESYGNGSGDEPYNNGVKPSSNAKHGHGDEYYDNGVNSDESLPYPKLSWGSDRSRSSSDNDNSADEFINSGPDSESVSFDFLDPRFTPAANRQDSVSDLVQIESVEDSDYVTSSSDPHLEKALKDSGSFVWHAWNAKPESFLSDLFVSTVPMTYARRSALEQSKRFQLLSTRCNGLPYVNPYHGCTLQEDTFTSMLPTHRLQALQRVQSYGWNQGCNGFFQTGMHFEHESIPKFEGQGWVTPSHIVPCKWVGLGFGHFISTQAFRDAKTLGKELGTVNISGYNKPQILPRMDGSHIYPEFKHPVYQHNTVLRLFFQNQMQRQRQKRKWIQVQKDVRQNLGFMYDVERAHLDLGGTNDNTPVGLITSDYVQPWVSTSGGKRRLQKKRRKFWRSDGTSKRPLPWEETGLFNTGKSPISSREGRCFGSLRFLPEKRQKNFGPTYRRVTSVTHFTKVGIWKLRPERHFRRSYVRTYGFRHQGFAAAFLPQGWIHRYFQAYLRPALEVQRLRLTLKTARGRMHLMRTWGKTFPWDIETDPRVHYRKLFTFIPLPSCQPAFAMQTRMESWLEMMLYDPYANSHWPERCAWTGSKKQCWVRNWVSINIQQRSESVKQKRKAASLGADLVGFIHRQPHLVRNRHAVVHNNWIHPIRYVYEPFRKLMLPYSLSRPDGACQVPNFAMVNYIDRGLTNRTSHCGAEAIKLGLQHLDLRLPGLHGWKKIRDYDFACRYISQLHRASFSSIPHGEVPGPLHVYRSRSNDEVYVSDKSKIGPRWELTASESESDGDDPQVKLVQSTIQRRTWKSNRRNWAQKASLSGPVKGRHYRPALATLRDRRYANRWKKRRLKFLRRSKMLRRLAPTQVAGMVLSRLPVLPADGRPVFQLEDILASSDLTTLYSNVLYYNDVPGEENKARWEKCKQYSFDPDLGLPVLSPSYFYQNHIRGRREIGIQIQSAVDALMDTSKRAEVEWNPTEGLIKDPNTHRLYKSLSDRLKGKTGRFRFNLLGKRVDYSARSVIVVGPTLKVHQCGLPRPMAFKLFYFHVVRQLVVLGYVKTTSAARRQVALESQVACVVLEKVLQDVPVLLNRAPTLHRLGFQAFQPRLVKGRAILLHPLVCTGFNADFDGDQMGVHVPISPPSKAEAQRLMASSLQVLGPAHSEPMLVPSQDIVLGCYVASHDDVRRRCEMWKQNQTGAPRFASFESVRAAYEANQIDLHTAILFDVIDFETDVTQRCYEVRIEPSGRCVMVFKTLFGTYAREKFHRVKTILTLAGRVLLNHDLWASEAF